jgi:hypothetical protein
MGAQWDDYYVLAGQSRDSSALEESNFRSFRAALEKKAKELGVVAITIPDIDNELEPVVVERSSHWAVGWVETLLVHKDSPVVLLEWCDTQLERLDGYPVFDESDYSELETEQAATVWRDCYRVADRLKYIREHRSQFEFRGLGDMLGCVRGNYFAGYASELLS